MLHAVSPPIKLPTHGSDAAGKAHNQPFAMFARAVFVKEMAIGPYGGRPGDFEPHEPLLALSRGQNHLVGKPSAQLLVAQ